MRKQLHNSTIFDWLDTILARSTEIMSMQRAAADELRKNGGPPKF